MAHRFTREELYTLVWSTPMSKVARKLGISDVAIAKACRRADIPTPGVGYWTKVQRRKKVKQLALPPATPATPTIVQISPGLPTLLRDLPPATQEEIARESATEWRITVPKSLSNPHRVVKSWLEEDRNRCERTRPPHDHSQQSRYGSKIERRRLRMLSALFGALEKRGHRVVAGHQNPFDVALVVNGERIEFSLSQRQEQLKEDLTHEEQRSPLNAALGIRSRTVLRPTDELIFKIHSCFGTGMRKQWRDTARKPLEEQLNSIVAGLLAAAAMIQRDRRQREEERRRLIVQQMERERQEEARRKETQRLQGLLQQVARWLQATNVRAYVHAVRSVAQTDHAKIDPARLETWASWALRQADQMDPIVDGNPLADSGS